MNYSRLLAWKEHNMRDKQIKRVRKELILQKCIDMIELDFWWGILWTKFLNHLIESNIDKVIECIPPNSLVGYL